jgi:hypothetical protein
MWKRGTSGFCMVTAMEFSCMLTTSKLPGLLGLLAMDAQRANGTSLTQLKDELRQELLAEFRPLLADAKVGTAQITILFVGFFKLRGVCT